MSPPIHDASARRDRGGPSPVFGRGGDRNNRPRNPGMAERAGWRERAAADEPTSAAETQSQAEILLLPDNSRDPELTKALRDAQDIYFA
jgi:hypothetical protein